MTARLPIVGSDLGTWGGILNTFLSVSLNSDGTLNEAAALAAIEEGFTAANEIPIGTGVGTGALTDLLTALGAYYTLGQILVGTGAGTAALESMLAAIEAAFTAKGQLLLGSGSGTGGLLAIGSTNQVLTVTGGTAVWAGLTAGQIEALFTAAGQVFLGSGSGTGALTNILTALEGQFTAAGQLVVGSGSGTGSLLARGTANQVLTVNSGGTGIAWATPAGGSYPLSTPLAGTLGTNFAPVPTLTTFESTSSLAVGTWLITFTASVVAASNSLSLTLFLSTVAGSATATFSGPSAIQFTSPTTSYNGSMGYTFFAVVTVAGTVSFQAQTSASGTGIYTLEAGTTGYTATRVA